MAWSANVQQEDTGTPFYAPIDFTQWTVFERLDPWTVNKIELVHIFGDCAELLSAIFVTSDDMVYGIGRNDFGRLGIGDSETLFVEEAREIDSLSGKRVVCFASGTMHALALTENGEMYSWGLNTMGPLGNGTTLNRDSPGKVLLPENAKIKAIAARSAYSLAVTTTNVVLHWGDVLFTDCSTQNMPEEIIFPEPISVRQIACSFLHVGLLTSDSKVFTWGCIRDDLRPRYTTTPVLVSGPEHKNLMSIACSLDITVAVNESFDFYVFHAPTSLKTRLSNQKTLKVLEAAGTPYSDSPLVLRLSNEGFVKFFPPYHQEDCECFFATQEQWGNIQNAFVGFATPHVFRKNINDILNGRRKIYGKGRNISRVLFDVKEFSDLTVLLSDGEVYVHKIILGAFCEHFKSMLHGSWSQNHDESVLDMRQYNPRAYRAFLNYIYSSNLDLIAPEDLIDLYDLSSSYLEQELVAMCSEMFQKSLKPCNIASLYETCVDHHLTELTSHLVEFTSNHLNLVVVSEGFDNLDPKLAKQLVVDAIKFDKS